MTTAAGPHPHSAVCVRIPVLSFSLSLPPFLFLSLLGFTHILISYAGSWYPIDFSPDDSKLLVKHYLSVAESELWVLDLKSSDLRQINKVETEAGGQATSPIAYGSAVFASESRVYLTSDRLGEFQSLWLWDLETVSLSLSLSLVCVCPSVYRVC